MRFSNTNFVFMSLINTETVIVFVKILLIYYAEGQTYEETFKDLYRLLR